jgi:hypothetical protein
MGLASGSRCVHNDGSICTECVRVADIDYIETEIERLRVQVRRERREILELHRARLNAFAAEAPLARIDELCADRDRPKQDPRQRRVEQGRYSLD